MKSCSIRVDDDIKNIEQIFAAELPNARSKRAYYEVSKFDGSLDISVHASDYTSLKAFTISILNILQTYEKLKELHNGT